MEMHDEFEGLNTEEKQFMERLEAFFQAQGPIAERFEVTHRISQAYANIAPEEAMVPELRLPGSSVFTLRVMKKDEAHDFASAQARAAGSADPCCWWRYINGSFFCVAYC